MGVWLDGNGTSVGRDVKEDAVSQSSEQHRARPEKEPEVASEATPAERTTVDKEALDADVDALLDEIDDVLEENAEEFVRGFVQKGGQ